MSWETVNLGDLCSVITKGTTPSNIGASFTDSGIKYIRSEMLTSAKYVSGDFLYISQETHEKLKRSQLKTGDILFSMAGVYLGKTAILRPEDTPSNTNQAVALIRIDTDKANNEFVYYYLNMPSVVKTANTVQSQSAQPNINLKQIGQLKIKLPDSGTQDKIVQILSAYDSLIENNQEQIKLLEEAAQRLYKEWFVDLRFPGYEDTPIVDGVPEGWTDGTLGEIASFKRGKTITKAQVQDGNIPVVAGGLEPAYYHNKANTVAPVITVSGSGANAGFARLYNIDVFASDCSFVDCETTPYLFFIYCFLKANKSSLDSLQKGSAQPHVYPKDLNALKLKVPTDTFQSEFCRLVAPYFDKIKTLQREIAISAEARNRLLPKLMSGEIEV